MIWTWLISISGVLFISVVKAPEIGSTTVIILFLFQTFYHPIQFFFLGRQEKQVKAVVTQSCLTLCDPMDCNPPGSSVHGILQARILGWVAMPPAPVELVELGFKPRPGAPEPALAPGHASSYDTGDGRWRREVRNVSMTEQNERWGAW